MESKTVRLTRGSWARAREWRAATAELQEKSRIPSAREVDRRPPRPVGVDRAQAEEPHALEQVSCVLRQIVIDLHDSAVPTRAHNIVGQCDDTANRAVEVLGDPRTAVVLRDVIFGNRRYFRELLGRSIEGIASNVLAARLRDLVAAGLLVRDEAVRGQRARYSLTEVGIQTVPVLVALGTWGLAHRATSPELAARQRVLEEGGSALQAQLMAELRAMHLGEPFPSTAGPVAMERLHAAYEDAIASRTPDGSAS